MSAYYILPIIQSVMSFSLALMVAVKGRRQSFVNRLFISLLCSLGLWGMIIFAMRSSPDTAHALLWERVLIPVILIIPTVFYHFSVKYTGSRVPAWLIPGLYVLMVLSVPLAFTNLFVRGMQLLNYGYAPVMGPLMPLSLLLIQALSVLALLSFSRIVRTSPDSTERSRAVYIMLGIIILDIGAIFDILPVFGLPLYPGLIIGSITFSILTTVAILKHNLLDIHIVLRKGAVYLLTAGSFLMLSLIIFALIIEENILFSQWSHIVILAGEVLILPFIWTFFQRAVDRIYFRDRYSYLKALDILSRKSHSITDEALGQKVVRLVAQAMRVSSAYLLLPDSSQENIALGFTNNGLPLQDISLDPQSPLMKWLVQSGKPVSRHELELMPQFVGRERAILTSLKTEIMIPGKTPTGRFAGLILLGEKLNHRPYTGEEKQIIQTFVDQIATKLENVRLYGEAMKMRQELQNLSCRLVQVQEEERREIARELHDEIGQSLVMTKMLIDGAMKSSSVVEEKLVQAQSTVKEVIAQVREMSLNLRPSTLDDLGLFPALEWFVERYSQRTGIRLDFKYEAHGFNFDGNLRTVTYRIIQESLNNIAKHAQTNEARISIAVKDGNLHIEIADNGVGFDPSRISKNSIGLMGMRERVSSLGGRMKVDSAPGSGAWIGIDIPLIERGGDGSRNNAG